MIPLIQSLGVACAGLVIAAAVMPLGAQGSLREQTSAVSSSSPSRILSGNPFMPLAGYFQGEFEQKLQENASIAFSGSTARWDNRRYLNADVKLRLYPQERGLEGLGLAAGVGIGRARQDDELGACAPIDCVPPVIRGRNVTAPSFSVEAHHQWLFGESKATAITVGGGLKRYFIGDAEARGIQQFVPTGRLTVGWAFR